MLFRSPPFFFSARKIADKRFEHNVNRCRERKLPMNPNLKRRVHMQAICRHCKRTSDYPYNDAGQVAVFKVFRVSVLLVTESTQNTGF